MASGPWTGPRQRSPGPVSLCCWKADRRPLKSCSKEVETNSKYSEVYEKSRGPARNIHQHSQVIKKIKPILVDQMIDLFLPLWQLLSVSEYTCTPAYKIGIRVPMGVTGVGSLS